MKWKILFLCSLLAFFAGLGVLISAWKGNASVKAAWPISGSVVELSGSATGLRAMAGLGGLLLAVLLFLWGVFRLVTGPTRRARTEVLPESSEETKQKATSR